jgi:hypothetical protein
VSATGGSQSDYLIVFSFSALSLLPAVLLDLSLSRVLKPLVRLGYSLSGVAVVMHLASLVLGRDFRQSALVLITVGNRLPSAPAGASARDVSNSSRPSICGRDDPCAMKNWHPM